MNKIDEIYINNIDFPDLTNGVPLTPRTVENNFKILIRKINELVREHNTLINFMKNKGELKSDDRG
jgi:hypothetical protein